MPGTVPSVSAEEELTLYIEAFPQTYQGFEGACYAWTEGHSVPAVPGCQNKPQDHSERSQGLLCPADQPGAAPQPRGSSRLELAHHLHLPPTPRPLANKDGADPHMGFIDLVRFVAFE